MTINGDLSKIDYDDNNNVTILKKKSKRNKQISLPVNKLIVWQYKKPKLLTNINVNELQNILSKANLSNYKKAIWLASAKIVVMMWLSNEIIFSFIYFSWFYIGLLLFFLLTRKRYVTAVTWHITWYEVIGLEAD